jgi:hypothetical protein
MFTVDHYIGSINANLETQSDLLVRNLKNIFSYNFSSDIDLLDFSAFIEPTGFELSITMFSMDKEGNEVFDEGNDPTFFGGSEETLPAVEYHQMNDSQLDDFFEFYEQNEETLVPYEQKVFTEWFRQCWEKAGGTSLKLPSYFIFHEDYKSYDLKNNKWVDDEEKWS